MQTLKRENKSSDSKKKKIISREKERLCMDEKISI
jgi:hypothetical protein